MAVCPDSFNRAEVAGLGSGLDTLDLTAEAVGANGSGSGREIRRKAWRKALTRVITSELISLNSVYNDQYRDAWYCGNRVEVGSGRAVHKLCGRDRFCYVCGAVRMAHLIDAYKEVIEGWADPQFLTLTVPNVPEGQVFGAERHLVSHVTGQVGLFPVADARDTMLTHKVKAMTARLRLAVDRTRKRDRIDFQAMRKLEVTYNERRRDYHPHFHLVVDGRAAAESLLDGWLLRWPGASFVAQDVRQATPAGVLELFKYFAKPYESGTWKKKQRTRPEALDYIFRSIAGLRIVQPMGFKVLQDEEDELETEKGVPTPWASDGVYVWETGVLDWVLGETGELLSDWNPTESQKRILSGQRE